MTLTEPPVARPYSGSKVPLTTWNWADGRLADDVGRPATFAARLAAKERLIEIRSIDVDRGVDAAAAREADLAAFRFHHHARGQLGKIQKTAAIYRQACHRVDVDKGCGLRTAGLDHRRLAFHRHGFGHCRDPQRNIRCDRLTQRQHVTLGDRGSEALRRCGDFVVAYPKQRNLEPPLAIGGNHSLVPGIYVLHDDLRVGNRSSRRILNNSLNAAGGGLRLSEQNARYDGKQ